MIKKIPLKVVYALAILLVFYIFYILIPVFRGYAFAVAACPAPNIILQVEDSDSKSFDKRFFEQWKNEDAQMKHELCIRSYIGRFGLK